MLDIDEIEDIRLNSLLVRESFFSFLPSRLSSSLSKLCIDWLRVVELLFDSLNRRPKDLQLLSDEDRGPALASLVAGETGGLGDIGSALAELPLDPGTVDF